MRDSILIHQRQAMPAAICAVNLSVDEALNPICQGARYGLLS